MTIFLRIYVYRRFFCLAVPRCYPPVTELIGQKSAKQIFVLSFHAFHFTLIMFSRCYTLAINFDAGRVHHYLVSFPWTVRLRLSVLAIFVHFSFGFPCLAFACFSGKIQCSSKQVSFQSQWSGIFRIVRMLLKREKGLISLLPLSRALGIVADQYTWDDGQL